MNGTEGIRTKKDWSDLTWKPLTEENWPEFENLFGTNGACGQCWCMNHRLPKKEFEGGKKDGVNRRRMKDLADKRADTGLLFYSQGEVVGWMAMAPREDFRRLEASRIHKPIDDTKVWSLPCTFIAKEHRRTGLSYHMIRGAMEYARMNDIAVLEAYPIKTGVETQPAVFLWVGIYESFVKAGFEVVDEKSPKRPMMRCYIN